MKQHIGDPKKASYEANTLNLHTGPLHSRLLRLFNETHEAVADGNNGAVVKLRSLVPDVLAEFERNECELDENPVWLKNKMRAGWHVALGEFDEALEYELAGWRAAAGEPDLDQTIDENRARRISVSASNIADQLLRLNRASEALPWAKLSVDLWHSNTVNHLVFSQVLYQVGMRKQADALIEELRKVARFGNRRDVLSKCMAYERALQDMVDLPSVNRLLQDVHRATNGPEWNTKEGVN